MVPSSRAGGESTSVRPVPGGGLTTLGVRPRSDVDATDDGADDLITIDTPVTCPIRCSPFGLTVLAGGGRGRIVLHGELDLAATGPLDDAVDLLRRAGVPFSVDCRNLTFTDGAGVRALLRARRLGGTLDGASGQVRRVFGIVGRADELEPGPTPRSVRRDHGPTSPADGAS